MFLDVQKTLFKSNFNVNWNTAVMLETWQATYLRTISISTIHVTAKNTDYIVVVVAMCVCVCGVCLF